MAVEFKQDSIKEWLEATQDKSTISDVTWHGCSGGTISELIYYADTSAFYDKYQDEIFERLSDMADDMGCESILHCPPIHMIMPMISQELPVQTRVW